MHHEGTKECSWLPGILSSFQKLRSSGQNLVFVPSSSGGLLEENYQDSMTPSLQEKSLCLRIYPLAVVGNLKEWIQENRARIFPLMRHPILVQPVLLLNETPYFSTTCHFFSS